MYVNQSFSFHLGILTVMQPGNYLEHEGEKTLKDIKMHLY